MNIKRLFHYLTLSLLLFPAIAPIRSWASSVSITSPSNGTKIAASCSNALANITITATATGEPQTNSPSGPAGGSTVVKVIFFYDGTHSIGEDTTAPYSIVWANVPVGTYTLTAQAVFSNGGTLTSSGVVITVDSPATTLDSNQSGYTFESGKTYYIKNPITISGTTELQGGAVLKYAPGAKITVDTLTCSTETNNFAILTARDDDSVGCMLPESTHSISGYYGGTSNGPSRGALSIIHDDTTIVQHLSIKYAWCAVYFQNDIQANWLYDVAIAHSYTASYLDSTWVSYLIVQNAQIQDVNTAFSGSYWAGNIYGIAVSDCYNLAHDDAFAEYGADFDYSTFSDVDNLDVGDSIGVFGSHNGFHNSPQFGTDPYTF